MGALICPSCKTEIREFMPIRSEEIFYFQYDRKQIAIGTVRNYVKSIKLFCDMADLQIPWAKIAGIKYIDHA